MTRLNSQATLPANDRTAAWAAASALSLRWARGPNHVIFHVAAQFLLLIRNAKKTCQTWSDTNRTVHYVNVSVLIKFSQKTSVFTLIIISSP